MAIATAHDRVPQFGMPTAVLSAKYDHLAALEAESIHIMREVVAEFERPVMLYSIGKDSSVLLRLAQKAFYPGPIPFPLLHVDTTYKFREMIEFRDSYVKEIGARLIVHTNTEAIADGTQPFLVGTQALLRRAQDQVAARRARGRRLRRGVRRRPPRRGAVARQGADLLAPRRQRPVGSEESAPRALEAAQQPHSQRREHPRVPAVELDRNRRVELHPRREHSGRAAVLRQGARGRRPRRIA